MAPKALYLLLIACILGVIIQMSLADSSKASNASDSSGSSDSSNSSNSSDSSDSSDSADSANSAESKEKPAVNKDDKKPQKPPTKEEEAENRTVVKKLEIVLPKIPAISPMPGLKPNVEKAKEMVAHRLSNGSNFVNAVADGIRSAVYAAKPLVAIGKLIAKIIDVFTEIASLNPIKLGGLVLLEGVKIGMGVLTVSLPLLIAGVIAPTN